MSQPSTRRVVALSDDPTSPIPSQATMNPSDIQQAAMQYAPQYATVPYGTAVATYNGGTTMMPVTQLQAMSPITNAVAGTAATAGTDGKQLLIVESDDSFGSWAERNWPWVAGVGAVIVFAIWAAYANGYTVTRRSRSRSRGRSIMVTPRAVRFRLVPVRR